MGFMTLMGSSPGVAAVDELPQPDAKDDVPIMKKIELQIANTFIQFSAPRSSSLDQFLKKREAQSCPGSRMVSVDEDEPVMEWPATRGPSLEEDLKFGRPPLSSRSSRTMSSRMASVDEELPEWPATRGPSLEEEMRCQANGMLPLEKTPIQFPAA
jgi:hypothetical protein